jgi:hypothetical protein
MLVNYLLLDSNNVVVEAPLFDTEINNGEVPDFILNRPYLSRIIKDYTGIVHVGATWDDETRSLIISQNLSNTVSNTVTESVPGGPDVIVE